MKADRFTSITSQYGKLKIAILGDFCLDRYLEIDPAKNETSLETGLTVYNVVNVRGQPGGAGTILNNLAALEIGQIYPIGFAGEDGEGVELLRAIRQRPGVDTQFFFSTANRRTFTYTKPLVVEEGAAPVELNRLDFKNWTPTSPADEARLIAAVEELAPRLHALILLDQVDLPNTGVVTTRTRAAVANLQTQFPNVTILADSRRGLKEFPPFIYKMNARELAVMLGEETGEDITTISNHAARLATHTGRPVFVTLAERGIIGAGPDGRALHSPALPLRGPIDIVGAGDAVTANLTASLSAGASVGEAIEIANAAASIVIHQLGTTGIAKAQEIGRLIKQE